MRRFVFITMCSLAAAAAFAQAPAPANAPAAKKVVKTGPGTKTKEEQQAVQAVLAAQMPDELMKAVDDLITKFPSTDFKSFALERAGEAALAEEGRHQGDFLWRTGPRGRPDELFDADNLLGNVLAATVHDKDLDKNEKLAKAEKYAHDSLTALDGPKPWMYTDAQWPKVKAGATSQAYQALGNAALAKKQTDEAIADFQKGIDAMPDPLLMIRAGRALLLAKKPDDAIVWFDKVINSSDAPEDYKNIAKNDKARAIQSKGK